MNTTFRIVGWIRYVSLRSTCYKSYFFSTRSQLSFLCGQPTHLTHPHLIGPNELTLGITATEYASRCAQLASFLPAQSLTVLLGARLAYKTGSSFYVFHQHPNFFYLTGVNEPYAVFVMERDLSSSGFASYLFLRPKNPSDERWEGPRTGIEAARDLFPVNQVYDLYEADTILDKFLRRASHIYVGVPEDMSSIPTQHKSHASNMLDKLYELLQSYSIQSITPWIHRLREIKSPAEIALMKQAASRSAEAFNIVMQTPVENEALLWAKLSYELKIRNCEEAYVPVIGGGKVGPMI